MRCRGCPSRPSCEVAISGIEVAIETTVRPITTGLIFKLARNRDRSIAQPVAAKSQRDKAHKHDSYRVPIAENWKTE